MNFIFISFRSRYSCSSFSSPSVRAPFITVDFVPQNNLNSWVFEESELSIDLDCRKRKCDIESTNAITIDHFKHDLDVAETLFK